MYFHEDAFDAYVAQLERNVEPQVFWKHSTTESYYAWLSHMFEQYKTYMTQEHDRTGRLPVTLMKNFKALCLEQGQNNIAQSVQDDLNKHS